MAASEVDPVEVAARALRHRDRSRADLAARLEAAGVDEQTREETLETFERVGYIDDTRFATLRAAALARRGAGDEAIRFDLEQGGVAREAIEEAVGTLEPESVRAAAIVERLGVGAKTAAHLARKGFGADAVGIAAGPDADV